MGVLYRLPLPNVLCSRLVRNWLCSGSSICTLLCCSKNEATKLMAITHRTLNMLYYFQELKVQICYKSGRNSVEVIALCLKKVPTFTFSVTLSNLNRFSKFLHYWKGVWNFLQNPYDITHFTICFPVEQKCWNSVKILQSYGEFKSGNFFETQCGSSSIGSCSSSAAASVVVIFVVVAVVVAIVVYW